MSDISLLVWCTDNSKQTTMTLGPFMRAVKSPSIVQRVFGGVDSVANLGNGSRIVRMKQEHIPTVMPTFHEFWMNEVTTLSVGCRVTDAHLWPLLFNLSRNPHSYLLLKDDEIVAHGLQWMLYKNQEKDPNRMEKAELNMEENDAFRTVVSMVDYAESTIFDIFPSESVFLHSLAAFVRPKYQASGIMTQLAANINRLNKESLMPLGVKGCLGVMTRRQNQRVLEKLGWKQITSVPDHIYNRPDGSPINFIPPGETNATICFYDFKKNLHNTPIIEEEMAAF